QGISGSLQVLGTGLDLSPAPTRQQIISVDQIMRRHTAIVWRARQPRSTWCSQLPNQRRWRSPRLSQSLRAIERQFVDEKRRPVSPLALRRILKRNVAAHASNRANPL